MKTLRCLLVLILLATLSLPAMAAGDAIVAREGFDGFDDSVRAICADGDLIWMYGYNAVHTYDASTGELHSYPLNAEARGYLHHSALDSDGLTVSASEQAWFMLDGSAHMIAQWFRFNQSRSIFENLGCTLEKIVIRDDEACLERVRELDVSAVPLDDGYFPQIEACFTVNGTAVLFSPAMVGPSQLYFLDPGANALRAVDVDVSVSYAIAWDDGILLIASDRQNRGQMRAGKMPLTGEAPAEWTPIPEGFYYPQGLVQYGSEILFVDENMLRAVNFESGVRNIADVPIDLNPNIGVPAVITPSGCYVAGEYGGVVVRKIERSEEAKTVLAISYSGDLTNAILKFQNAHDNVNVRLVYDTDNALDGLLTKSAQWDILILNSHYDAQILRPILNRGWALPIQSESVRAFVSGALPGVSAPLMQNGEVLGVPLDVDCYSAGVNVGCLNAMNLSIEDIPANWVDLLEYIQSLIPTATVPLVDWQNSADDLRADLLRAILESYDLEIQSGAQSGYDTPELRAALEALDNLDLESLNAQAQRANEETNRHYNPMFGWHGACAAPCGEKYLDEYQFIPLALSFSKDSPARLPMDCNIAILNPASENVGLANDFLKILIGQMDADVRAAFAPAKAEPLLDQAVYDRQTSQQDEMIAQLETALGTAAESAKQELQEKLDHERAIRLEMEDWYWAISEESLARYQANANGVLLNLPTGSFSDLYTLVWEHVEKREGTDALIRALQKKLDMSRMEDGR